jgi:hypothetical protein
MGEYRERLRVPVSWWLLAAPAVIVLGSEFYAVLGSPWPPVIIGCLAGSCAALLVLLGRGQIDVRDGTLTAGGNTLPLTAISEVAALDERQTARLRGPSADPAAFLYSRPYLKRSVYLALDDGRIPYWLIGTRHPAELAAVVARGRGGRASPRTGGHRGDRPPGETQPVT